MKEENQNLRAEIVKYYFAALDEVEKIASETDKKWNHMLTMLDGVAKDYENWRDEKLVITVELDEHGREIEALNQKDAKKETAIQDLQQRVTTLENAGDGKPPTPEPSIKE
jgi:chromosome segregation ATPase